MNVKQLIAYNKLCLIFKSDVEDDFKFTFKCINVSDFELNIIYFSKSKILDRVFNQIKRILCLKKEYKALRHSSSDNVEKFEIPPQFHNRVHTAIHSNIKSIAKEVIKDGILVLRTGVDKCIFERKNKHDLEIKILVTGQYVKK